MYGINNVICTKFLYCCNANGLIQLKSNMIFNGALTYIVVSLLFVKLISGYNGLTEESCIVKNLQYANRQIDCCNCNYEVNSIRTKALRYLDRILKGNVVSRMNSKTPLLKKLLSTKHDLQISNNTLHKHLFYLLPHINRDFRNRTYLFSPNNINEKKKTKIYYKKDYYNSNTTYNKKNVLNVTPKYKVQNHSKNEFIETTTVYQIEATSKAQSSENDHETSVQLPENILKNFGDALDQFQRKFLQKTFLKLSTISSSDRQENGISFVQSGFFLYLLLMALSTQVNQETKVEIEKCIGNTDSDSDKMEAIMQILAWLPKSNDDLKFRWATRLVFGPRLTVRQNFKDSTASLLQLHIEQLNGTETPEMLAKYLNLMVEQDSGGAMHNTFDEDELSGPIQGIAMNTVYLRATWRVATTLLNGTRVLQDATENAPRRPSMRMIRINDIMMYADLNEMDAEVIELSYAVPGLTLLVMVPRGRSLRSLMDNMTTTHLKHVTERMYPVRVAATLPLYTLRMTLLLPSKLREIGITRLVNISNTKPVELRLSHAVQRIMFWAEAGRNAFKDDGIEWDEPPEIELMVDRPYIFFVRWQNITLVNGNFVL